MMEKYLLSPALTTNTRDRSFKTSGNFFYFVKEVTKCLIESLYLFTYDGFGLEERASRSCL